MKKNGAKTLARVALAAVIITVCSWISVPYVIPFTLQTFAVFFALVVLGGKQGTAAIIVYVLLGVAGVPVFSGFKGGIGALLGATGGYVFGFVLSGAAYHLLPFKEKNFILKAVACFISLLVCYAAGTLWFWFVYSNGSGAEGLIYALTVCVLPYILFDVLKIIAAVFLGEKIKKIIDG